MTHVLVMGLPLVAGLALALLAERGRWAPPLAVALAVGAVLRVTVMLIAAQDTFQPYDLDEDFRSTADTVLDGRDPLFHLREGGWHFLPMLAYVLAGVRYLSELVGLPWEVAGRVVPVLADLALVPLVAKLSSDPSSRVRALRGFQYACAPVVLMVSALHGQFAPITLALGAAALLAARGGRAHLAGVLIGLSVTSASWSVLLLPGVLLTLPALRRRIAVLAWTAVVPLAFLLSSVPLLGTPAGRLRESLSASMGTRPVAGDWGWSAVVTGGDQVVSPGFGTVGTPLLAVALLAAAWWWRRADPVSLTLALLLVFLIVTYRFGAQYLAWPVPYLLMRSSRGTLPVLAVTGVWAAFGYLYMSRLEPVAWREAHVWWALSSLLVIALFVYALPGRRRDGDASSSGSPGQGRGWTVMSRNSTSASSV
ncbi:hypothetical protein BZB76_5401 [Actinomadura pelletieri DSM 43383]|uniref:Alpha-1,2-mannosyltransferase n=1 Tax=Actinomadura pelletieri DSM 43383 TaxID=1120940 RepID=A0A495QGS9_9ACTN|nr:hypothetical protein [Actinomadura pelletieri]RKS70921.1 hypothetical protein BZB76_5401 [Actinomadura pelletieri DSM 43383]